MNEKEILFKVLVVGDAEVGKTSFVRRYVRASYDKNYKATLGGNIFNIVFILSLSILKIIPDE